MEEVKAKVCERRRATEKGRANKAEEEVKYRYFCRKQKIDVLMMLPVPVFPISIARGFCIQKGES